MKTLQEREVNFSKLMPKYSSSFPDFLECFESSNYYYIIYELLKYTLEKKSDEYGASMPGILHFFKKTPLSNLEQLSTLTWSKELKN